MLSIRFKISLILLILSLFYSGYEVYNVKIANSRAAINISTTEMTSTTEWQEMVLNYLNRRNEIINDVLRGKFDNNKKWISQLKLIECPPLLNGDIALLEYMSKNPMQFNNNISNLKIEYSNIKQLTNNEVVIDSRISFIENNINRIYNYEIKFKKIDNRWFLSKYTFSD